MTRTIVIGATGWLGAQLMRVIPGALAVPAASVIADRGLSIENLLRGRAEVVLNAAGARSGSPSEMREINVVLPTLLAGAVARQGGHLVHLGSAAEYGIAETGKPFAEEDICAPTSDYGITKLAGTEAVVSTGRATILRIFNIASTPAQARSPLADVAARIRDAVHEETDVSLLSPMTVRDWVTADFVHRSVVAALDMRPIGVFNISSGVGVKMLDAAQLAVQMLGSHARVREDGPVAPTVVMGRPEMWYRASGLAEMMSIERLAEVLRDCAA